MRDHWNKQLQLASAFDVRESAFSLQRWLVGLVTPNKSDARWAETALAHRVVSSDRLHLGMQRLTGFTINRALKRHG